jgi:serine/threonine protein kinase/tetratricopeptide (TPR) repeat protein
MENQPPDRIRLADEVFSAALDLPPAERTAFVRQRCGNDTTLTETVLQLLDQYERLGDFLEAGAFAPSQASPGEFQAGELLNNGRFRLIELVGRGGMGEVYRAEDTELADIVALKVLRSRFRGEEHLDARFRGEIRLARKISHPNVCHIFELFVETRGTDEILYFTMEFLEGQTLAQTIAQGPMDPPEALALARQIAAGLDAVHHAGIIHRDLKPANILLVPDKNGGQRAVLTDFGLAKVFDGLTASGHTLPGQIAGTPEYMAPEQFLGAPLTPATDVFSFGLIVREMLSGSRPPSDDNVVRLAMRRLSEPPEPLSRTMPSVPPAWDAVLARALAPDAGNRYASASVMIRALDDSVAATPLQHSLPRRISRRTWIVSGAATTGVACIGAFLRYIKWTPTLPAKPLVMLTPTTQSIDSNDGPTAAGAIGLLLADQLQQSAHIRILPKDRMQSAWQRITGSSGPMPSKLTPAQARDIAMREGAQFVVFSNLSRVADEQVLELRLQLMGNEPAHARKEWPKTLSARHMTDLPAAVYDSASWVRGTAGESAGDIETHSRHPDELTTPSWQALQEYTQGDDAWKASKSDAAILHLKTALDLDPKFARAASRLADILIAQSRPDEGLPYHAVAAQVIRERNLTDRESLTIRGLFALDIGQNAEAEQIFNRYSIEYPDDGLALFYKATAIDLQGRADEALTATQAAIALDPHSYSFLMQRAVYSLNVGRLDEAATLCDRAAKLMPSDWTDQLNGSVALDRFDPAGVQRSIESMRVNGSLAYKSRVYGFEACLRAEQGRFDEAEQLIRAGLAFDSRMGLGPQPQFTKNRLLVQLLLRRRRTADSVRLCAVMLASKPGYENTMSIGCMLAQAGEPRRAENCLIQGLPNWPIYEHWIHRLKGEVALARGAAGLALQLMQSAPPSRIKSEWPEYIVRAALASRDTIVTQQHVSALVRNPGRYWFQADMIGPGFISWALAIGGPSHLTETDLKLAESLRQCIAKFK